MVTNMCVELNQYPSPDLQHHLPGRVPPIHAIDTSSSVASMADCSAACDASSRHRPRSVWNCSLLLEVSEVTGPSGAGHGAGRAFRHQSGSSVSPSLCRLLARRGCRTRKREILSGLIGVKPVRMPVDHILGVVLRDGAR